MTFFNKILTLETLDKLTIVVSFYAGRSTENLEKLLVSLEPFKKQTIIVMNSDQVSGDPIQKNISGWQAIIRENKGMNIGAWNEGFSAQPHKDYYFFLQDECFIKNLGFIETCIDRFLKNSKLAMLGESLNNKWNYPWEILAQSSLNWKDDDHQINGHYIPRVEFYLRNMKSLGINCGKTGLHLRSLFWAFRGDALRTIKGFPVGHNKGECIAAEIGISRKILQQGYEFDQITLIPFNFIGHSEWKADGSSKL